ncbi:MAG: sigma 54-interacting transcriptional regulator [Candidatus Edwardsbacteria bacterium]|nr:sigma 54-interacting transcriptional regulator [Candidatus Edwardsbacteria bacterium]
MLYCYGLIWRPSNTSTDFYLNGYVYAICFFLVAGFSGFLSERVRLKGRQLEQASRALEDFRLSTGDILEKMGSGLLTLNSAGQIRYCNAAGAQIIGIPQDRLVGGALESLFTGGLADLGRVLARELAADGRRAVRREIAINRADGGELPIGLSTTPVPGGEGSVHGLIAIFQDLSEVKQAENRMMEIEQLESMRELTASLLAMIRPEVAAIDGALRPILDGKVDGRAAQSLAAVARQHLDAVVKAGDDYQRFARVELPPGAPAAADGAAEHIVGAAPPFAAVLAMVRQIAPSDSTVLIYGESGTGKELLARELHRLSHRSQGPFVCINCAALPETLLESELFGHVRGSFTGAVRDKEGLFRVASGGTVFLDEVSETSPAIQVKLLRVLQEREIVPVGGTRPIKVDVRLVSATNVDLSRAVEQGRFRTDLFYRINVIPVKIPPLRERPTDIPMLADHFLHKVANKEGSPVPKVSAAALAALGRYQWPGNVRELENAIERAVVLAAGPLIEPAHLPPEVIGPGTRMIKPEAVQADNSGSLKTNERQAIINALQQTGGNKSQAAKSLGIHYTTLYRKMKHYGLE